MSSWSSLASRFSISSSRADLEGSSHTPCGGTNQSHSQMSAGALAEPGHGSVLPVTGWVSPTPSPSPTSSIGVSWSQLPATVPCHLALTGVSLSEGCPCFRTGLGTLPGSEGEQKSCRHWLCLPGCCGESPCSCLGVCQVPSTRAGAAYQPAPTPRTCGPRPHCRDPKRGLWDSAHCQNLLRTSFSSFFTIGVVTRFSIPWGTVASFCQGSSWGDLGESQRRS